MRINKRFDSAARPSFTTHLPKTISEDFFHQLLFAGHIVDGRMGGVVLGKGFGDGNARILFKLGSEYVLHGAVAGGCFIVCREASCRNLNRLRCMNAGLTKAEVVPEPNQGEIGQLIVTTAYPHDRLVWVDFNQIVVNAAAAEKHMGELNQMNNAGNRYLMCDYYELFGFEPGTADGIV